MKTAAVKNLFFLLLSVLLVSGCGKTLKHSWGNFRAYYNTYYNAESNYQAGLKKVQDQPLTLETSSPVRIHRAPLKAGVEEFEKAIDKGAKILRSFPTSKWVDDALLLIGKSYYYQQHFFPAFQKFEELQNISTTPKMEQFAVIWKGRTLLDLEQNQEGISFLEKNLANHSENWSKEKIAEIQALIAEHYAMLGNWNQSAGMLSQAIPRMAESSLLGRTFFLYGQVLQRLERYGDALQAFSNVRDHFPGFEYTYQAEIKRADVAREVGKMKLATSIYENLLKDDKFFPRRDELEFKIAETLEMKGEITEAEKRYHNLLTKKTSPGSSSFKADIYYRLGKINSTAHNNYSVAAAYFDSSSSLGETQNSFSDRENAQTLAQVFGEYNQLQSKIQHTDSLLWLGSLEPSELDSVLKQIRTKRDRELLANRESPPQNTLANINIDNESDQATGSGQYGFLNHRSSEFVKRAKAAFQIIWGNRKLADNWRRQTAVQQTSEGKNTFSAGVIPNVSPSDESSEVAVLNKYIGKVPQTAGERRQLQINKENAQYELGNLLFLNLNAPDKAKHYFHKLINSNSIQRQLRARAMYSLYEIYDVENNEDSLKYWKNRILEQYPSTKYGQRILKNKDSSFSSITSDSANKLTGDYQQLLATNSLYTGAKLRTMALAHKTTDIAPYIYYQAISQYISQAKAFNEVTDSLHSKELYIKLDSTYYSSGQQFDSVYWDSVRMVMMEFDTTFSNAEQHKKVAELRNILGEPQPPTCGELGIALKIEPGMQAFLSTIDYPEKLKKMTFSGKITYLFTVTGTGEIESYKLVSPNTSLGIEEAFEKSIAQNLQFAPPTLKNGTEKIRCPVTFLVRN